MSAFQLKSTNAILKNQVKHGGKAQLARAAQYAGIQFQESAATGFKFGIQTKKYDELSKHPIVRTCLDMAIGAVFWSGYNINVVDSDSKIQNKLKDLIEKQFDAMKPALFDVLRDMLYSGMVCGYTVCEPVWKFCDNEWQMTRLKSKKSWDFTPVADDWGALEYLYHYPTGYYFNPSHFVFAPFPYLHAENYLGMSVMESALHDLIIVNKLSAKRAKNASLAAIKTLVHFFDANRDPGEISLINDLFDNSEENDILHIPANLDMTTQKLTEQDHWTTYEDRASGTIFADIKSIIDESIKNIKRLFGITDELGATTLPAGSYAKAKVSYNMFLAGVDQRQKWICDIVNSQIIPMIIKYNFKDLPVNVKLPQFTFDPIEEEYSLDKVDLVNKAVSTGIISSTEPWVREYVGFPEKSGAMAEAALSYEKIAAIKAAIEGGLINSYEPWVRAYLGFPEAETTKAEVTADVPVE